MHPVRMMIPRSKEMDTQWVFPPADVVEAGMPAIREFLLAHYHPLKILLLILAARRRRMRHLPAELWVLIREEFFSSV